jgi:DnaK suppressor protein
MKEKTIKELETKLLRKKRELVGEVRSSDIANPDYREEPAPDILDQASSSYTKEFLMSLGDSERKMLKEVDSALKKIKIGGYGDCEMCNEPIAEKRLLAVPFTRYCLHCQEEKERKES